MADESIPQSRPIVTRAEAKRDKLRRYFTGKPCLRGHVAERATVNGHCIECRDEAISRFCETHKDRRNKARRDRYAERPKAKREQARKRRLRNLARFRERDRLTYIRHRKKRLEWFAQYQRDNPDKVRAREARRRARKASAPGTHSESDIAALLKAQRGKCFYCDRSVHSDYHVEHFVSLFRGGSNGPENLRIACATCNARKGTKDPHVFLAELERERDARRIHITRRHVGPLEHERSG